MAVYRVDLMHMEVTVLVLAVLVVVLKLAVSLFKLTGQYTPRSKTLKFAERQPYLIASFIILSYFVVNNIGLPTLNLMIFGLNWFYFIYYAVQVIRFILTIFLIYNLENGLYCWIKQLAKQSKLAKIMLSIRNSFRLLLFSILLPLLMPRFILLPKLEYTIYVITSAFIIWSLTWFLIRSITAAEKIYFINHSESTITDYRARGVATQTRIFKKIIFIILVIVAIALTCLIFESARAIGASILASAGIATGILGFAANKIIANFFAGIQIAITKPVKINDLVKIGEDYGTVEDVSLNYVVIRLWDLRHLIVPINYFIGEKFYNYSLYSTAKISVVFFYADYSVPVDEIRQEFLRIMNESTFWDKQTARLQVIEFLEKSLKFRGVATTKTPSDAWDLKCEVMEKLAAFFINKYPNSLPKFRIEGSSKNSKEELS